MNESFTIQFKSGNTLWPVTDVRQNGIVINRQTDAWPRRCTLTLVPQSPGTIIRMKNIAHMQEWQYPEYHLKCGFAGGAVVFSGVDPDALPAGEYLVTVEVEDLPVTASNYKLYLPANGTAALTVDVHFDPRKVELKPKLNEEIQRVLTASTLDDMPAMDWLQNSSRGAARQACLLNLMAKLCSIPWWDAATTKPLILQVDEVFYARTERIYVQVKPGFYEDLSSYVDAQQHFYLEGTPKAPIHQDLLDLKHLSRDDYDAVSFRQEGQHCMQAVVARPKKSGPWYADLDIDLGNPLQDVEGIIIHLTELIEGGPTDHLKLCDTLSKDASTAPYMCYTLTV